MSLRRYITLVLAVGVLLGAAGLQPLSASAAQGTVAHGRYSEGGRTLPYDVYVPPTYKPAKAVPLIVAMHGCTQTADQLRKLTRFDELADTKNFIVVFPQQTSDANQFSCWNFFQSAHMRRGAGEPALIAGITKQVRERYSVDSRRIYATGLSAGGAMAAVMGATYPDVFAASGLASGCEYASGAACAGYRGIDPEQAGRQAYQAMGSAARMLPVIVFQGDNDKTVPPVNAQQAVKQWQVTADLADDGARNLSVPAAPTSVVTGATPGGRRYTVSHYGNGRGGELMQSWLVHGMGHAWSGGCSCQQYSDPAGPNATAKMYDFFMAHPAP